MDPRTIKQKRDHYLQEIARRASPRNRQDKFKLDVYQGLSDSIDWVLMFGGSLMTEVPTQICNSDVRSRRSVLSNAGQMMKEMERGMPGGNGSNQYQKSNAVHTEPNSSEYTSAKQSANISE